MEFFPEARKNITNLWDNFTEEMYNKKHLLPTDIYELNNKYYLETELPGFKKENIKVDYQDGHLVLTAKREFVEDDKKIYIKREKNYGEYTRRFYLNQINKTEIKASHTDGILTIIVPKSKVLEKENSVKID